MTWNLHHSQSERLAAEAECAASAGSVCLKIALGRRIEGVLPNKQRVIIPL